MTNLTGNQRNLSMTSDLNDHARDDCTHSPTPYGHIK